MVRYRPWNNTLKPMPRFRLLPLLLMLLASPALFAAPRVLTSIRPLQLIANDILRGVGEADVLLDSRQSPHHFQLKPSQLRKLQNSDLLIWISDDFETGLARLKNSLPPSAQRLQLLPLLESRRQEQNDGDKPGTAGPAEHEHDENAHLWLSPSQDARMAMLIADALSKLDPVNANTYRRNLERLILQLSRWQQQARQQLRKAHPRFLLDHPFLEPFEEDLGIHSLGALAGVHARGGSARQLHELEQRLRKTPASCLFSADWPADRRSRQFARQFGLKLEWMPILDPERKAESILDLLDDIRQRLLECGEKP